MTLVNPKPLGYAKNEILPSGDVNSVWSQLPDAVDGNGGGSYTPAAAIVLADEGIQVSGKFDAPGNALYNVKRYDAAGDGVADDTAEIQAAEDAVSSAGGAWLEFPPGTYRITADLVKKHKVHWRAVPGTVTVIMDHATENFFTFTGSAWTQETIIYGINFEAAQANTGTFCLEAGTLYKLRFVHCALNKSAALLTGQLFSNVASSELALVDCDFRAVKVNVNHYTMDRITLVRGKQTMAPAATSELIRPVVKCFVQGTEFVQVSTVGNVAFFDVSAGNTRVVGAIFNVDDSGAGNSTYAFRVNGGTLHTADCDFASDVLPYEYVAAAADGSELQLLPYLENPLTGTTYTVPYGYRILSLDSNTTKPTLTLQAPLYRGQPFTAAAYNHSGGNWASGAMFSGVVTFGGNVGAINNTQIMTKHFVAMRVNAGTLSWVQIGAEYVE